MLVVPIADIWSVTNIYFLNENEIGWKEGKDEKERGMEVE